MWIIFFKMILSRLRQEGWGRLPTETSSADGNSTGRGLVTFADDMSFFEATPELAQRSAQIVEDVLALVCLKIATQKSLQMSLIWVNQKGIDTYAEGEE